MTLTTADNKIVAVAGCIIYHINDLRKLYDTLQHPEDVIEAEVATRISAMFASRPLTDCGPEKIVSEVVSGVDLTKYGMSSGEFFVTDFVVFPRTIRLVNGAMERYCRGASFDTDSFVQPTANRPM